MPKFLLKHGRLVKGVEFRRNIREAGNPLSTAKVYDSYGVDELLFLDIESGGCLQRNTLEIVENVSKEIFMPLTVGGGIGKLEDINELLIAGADKVAINSAAVECPRIVKEAAKTFGNQCIVCSVDYKEISRGIFRVYSKGGSKQSKLDPISWCMELQDNHCGEVLISSIDRDGTMEGYDLEMINRLSEILSVPIIASSGAGSLDDCYDAFMAGASAITISSMFIFSDHSPIKVRSYLWSKGIRVRASKSSRN